MSEFDVVFIGAGPGGYTGAIRCAQLGLKTAVIEKDKTLGGTCLNVGCIPSKALLDSSEHFHQVSHDLETHGVMVSGVKLDLKKMMERKDKIVSDLTGGVDYLFKKNKIERLQGLGRLKSETEVEVLTSSGKTETVKAKNIILATGSVPNALPGVDFDGKRIISSTEALSLNEVPKHLIVIGGGVIGLELGSVWLRLGAKVTVLEYADNICGAMDKQVSKKLQQILKKQGMEFHMGVKVTSAKSDGKKVSVSFETLKTGESQNMEADYVLVATGRRPFSEGVRLDAVGIEKDQRGFVKVNSHYQTSCKNIYAIGDLIPGPMLAHKAEEEGVAVAEIIAGQSGHVNYDTVPSVVYTWPEVASVGKTEEQLKAEGVAYNSGSFPFSANGRAKALGTTDGMVKILADKKSDKILGVHILGPRASDIICEAVVAMEFGSSSEDVARSFHAHPTLPEVIREAALAVDKRARQS
ncbi:MAG TPA: dihydrolipoyl dehydrogenase [Bdellovibrionales bacterium]|nr:dihydrolipoyl dehydrogenase [Pseudobdellovibrionaceae bacterium]HAG90504.1 dihydrolipoyl dehydrogenase [Bdellovibrionales bacterium]|tara:strand:+ start:3978 stop:5381 length:1404 start_codon:yes stop_codon:yes gene_type:complete